jgi:hypothetical protein
MNSELIIWPTFYIVGAPKCGTTTVWEYLRRHPEIFFPKVKEPNFFMADVRPAGSGIKGYAGNLEAYQALYKNAKGYKAIGDASPSYLWAVDVPKRIHDVCPHARIVILLRDPAQRAYSHHIMYQRDSIEKGRERVSFAEVVRPDSRDNRIFRMLVEPGMYYEQVLRYFKTFGREQVGVYLMEDLNKDTENTVAAICRHIGVDPARQDMDRRRTHNVGRVPRVNWLYKVGRKVVTPKLRQRVLPRFVNDWLTSSPYLFRPSPPASESSMRYLQTLFEPDLCRLEELLGRKLPQLRKSWDRSGGQT